MSTEHPLILLVDDNPKNIQVLGATLKEKYQIQIAYNGNEALSLIEKKMPDLILLDIMMPHLDGIETCKKLKASSVTRDIPIIFLTAKVEPDDIVKGFDVGASDYVTKPFNTPVLLARVKTHLTLYQQTKQLRELTNIDGLTLIANRRHFDNFLENEWRRCLRSQASLSLIMIDIDFFKLYNDHYGHLKGDEVLKSVAQVINHFSQRPGDLACRFGGEEFVMILSRTDYESAHTLANKVREKVESLAIPHEKSEVKNVITISLGVSSVVPNRNDTSQHLTELADKKLYKAKADGRNCVR